MEINGFNIINNDLFRSIGRCSDELQIKCFVIGGFVRDKILNLKSPKDIDILAIGDGIKLAKKVSDFLNLKNQPTIYKNFGTAAFCYKGYEIEFVGSRSESYNYKSRNPTVKPGSLDDDLNRRDFTINSIGICLNHENWGEIVDKFNGLKDIKNKLIKTTIDPLKTFSDDPLRMLRAIRFSCQLNFKIDQKSIEGIKLERIRIKIISQERITDEINKILMTKKP